MPVRIRPGLLSVTFRKRSHREVVGLAADAGLVAVEWGGDVHVPHGDLAVAGVVRRMCDDRGLAVSAYGSYLRAGDTSGTNPPVNAVLDTAVALGAPTVRVWAGTRGSADTVPAERAAVVEDLARYCDAAAANGLTISTEFHGGTLTDDVASAIDLLTAVDRPNLRTFWQPPNGMAAADAVAGLNRVRPWLSNVHVFHWWPDGNVRHPLADGGDRWFPYLRAVAALTADDGRDRYASLEFVRGDDVAQFRDDAATLLAWLGKLT